MTTTDVQKLTDEELRVRVAELCGWKKWQDEESGILGGDWSKFIWTAPGSHHVQTAKSHPPDYPRDLNAMHEAEKTLTDEQHEEFRKHLRAIVARDAKVNPMSDAARRAYISAKANQRCEAFVLTMEEVKP